MAGGLVRGATDVARGFHYLMAHPRLWGWVVAPAILTLILIIAIIAGVLALIAPAVAWVAVLVPDFLEGWVGGVLRLLVVVGLASAGFVVYVSVSGMLAGPFCELLSESIEERVTGKKPPPFSPIAFVRGLVIGIVHSIRRLGVYLATLALVFVLGAALPVVGPAAAMVVGAYLAARASAYDCYDAVLARRGLSYRDKGAYLRAHRGRTVGLGAVVAGLLLVPGVNLVALGLGAAGATLAALDLESRAR
ncbi:MAG TPA: EI24 domain-containing protein [Kofleriaceae bacterium]|nr:EI24 domain-containing protein [Kofleriaceae bacterium]